MAERPSHFQCGHVVLASTPSSALKSPGPCRGCQLRHVVEARGRCHAACWAIYDAQAVCNSKMPISYYYDASSSSSPSSRSRAGEVDFDDAQLRRSEEMVDFSVDEKRREVRRLQTAFQSWLDRWGASRQVILVRWPLCQGLCRERSVGHHRRASRVGFRDGERDDGGKEEEEEVLMDDRCQVEKRDLLFFCWAALANIGRRGS